MAFDLRYDSFTNPTPSATGILRAAVVLLLSTAVLSALLQLYNAGGVRVMVGPIGPVPQLAISFWPVVWMIPAALWFGIWGALAWSLALLTFGEVSAAALYFLAPLTAGLVARWWAVDPSLPTMREYLSYAGVVLIAGLIFALAFAALEQLGMVACPPSCFLYEFVGLAAPGLVLAPIVLRLGTPLVEHLGAYYPRFFGLGVGRVKRSSA